MSTHDLLITAEGIERQPSPSPRAPTPLQKKIDAVPHHEKKKKSEGIREKESAHKRGRHGKEKKSMFALMDSPVQHFSSFIDLDNMLVRGIFISQSKEINYSLMA